MSNFEKVKKFMETFGQEVKNTPSFSTDKINNLQEYFGTDPLTGKKEQLIVE